ncbi:MAG: signal recognition particle-docking protein FtsY [Acidobacteriota bacterium]
MFGKIRQGLIKTRETFGKAVESIFKEKKEIKKSVDELEETLILADIGLNTVQKLLKDIFKEEDPKQALKNRIKDILLGVQEVQNGKEKPYIHIFVGVNGVGKTTTIGKIAKKRKENGEKGIIAACDTFRAAASEQLEIWAERSGTEIVKQQEGADPAAVAFDAVSKAKAKSYDFCLIDTAGRLHTKHNLMEELQKISRVAGKALPGAPHQTTLVLDATTGQNGLNQAKEFVSKIKVTDLILTKLDGTAKGGIAVSIVDELRIPISYVGVGEKVDDLVPFDPKEYAEGLFD